MTRRKFYSSLLGTSAAFAGYAHFLEPNWLQVTRPTIKLALPEPIRILQLSDLHRSTAVPLRLIESAIDLGLRDDYQPDLICVTGDFITGPLEREAEYSRALARLAKTAPTYAVMGNHDGGAWVQEQGGYADHSAVDKLLENSGIHILHNRAERITIRNTSIWLAGVGDLWSGEVDAKATFADIETSTGKVILLAHNPDTKDVLSHQRWDLMLSGHTHGAQVIIPFDGPRFAPVIDKRYVAGLGQWGSRQIHVSRGVGNLFGVRFGCRPEVNLLEIV